MFLGYFVLQFVERLVDALFDVAGGESFDSGIFGSFVLSDFRRFDWISNRLEPNWISLVVREDSLDVLFPLLC